MGSAPSVITERASGARPQLEGDRPAGAPWQGAGWAAGAAEGPRGEREGQGSSLERSRQWDLEMGPGAGRRPRSTWTRGPVREPHLGTVRGDPEAPEGQQFHPTPHSALSHPVLPGASLQHRGPNICTIIHAQPGVSCDPGQFL